MPRKKVEEVMKVDESITETKVETIISKDIKYRHEFKSWRDYWDYKGKKG